MSQNAAHEVAGTDSEANENHAFTYNDLLNALEVVLQTPDGQLSELEILLQDEVELLNELEAILWHYSIRRNTIHDEVDEGIANSPPDDTASQSYDIHWPAVYEEVYEANSNTGPEQTAVQRWLAGLGDVPVRNHLLIRSDRAEDLWSEPTLVNDDNSFDGETEAEHDDYEIMRNEATLIANGDPFDGEYEPYMVHTEVINNETSWFDVDTDDDDDDDSTVEDDEMRDPVLVAYDMHVFSTIREYLSDDIPRILIADAGPRYTPDHAYLVNHRNLLHGLRARFAENGALRLQEP